MSAANQDNSAGMSRETKVNIPLKTGSAPIVDLTNENQEPESPGKYKTIDDVSDDESDIKYLRQNLYEALTHEKELNILASKETIEKEDEDYKKLNDEVDDDIDENFEQEGDEEDLNNDALATTLSHRMKHKKKMKSSFIIDKSIKIDPSDILPLEEGLEPMTNREKQGLLMRNFTSEQASRYAAYKRAALSQSFFKKVSTAVIGSNLTGTSQFAISGLARYFMFELLEKCRDVYDLDEKVKIADRIVRKRELKFEEYKENKRQKRESQPLDTENLDVSAHTIPPLLPSHVREAYRLYKYEREMPTNNIRQMGDGDGMMFR